MAAGGAQVLPKKKSKWMKKMFRKLVIQPSSRDVLERPENAVEGALGARLSKAPFRDSFTAVDPDWVKTLVSLWPPVRHLKVQVRRF